TPLAWSRSRRACAVPRAIPSRRDASSTPIRGLSLNRVIRLRSISSISALPVCKVFSVSAYCCTVCISPAILSRMTTPASGSTLTALTQEEEQAGLSLEQLQQLVGLVEYDASTDPFPVTGMDSVCFVVG